MSTAIKGVLKHVLVTALALSVVLTLVPMFAGAMTTDVTTAKSNETGTDNILGGVPTRVTWEAVVDEGEKIAELTVQLPEGSAFNGESSVRLTVLDDTTRLDDPGTATIDAEANQVKVQFNEPLDPGLRVRVEMYKTALPNVTGDVTLSGTYTTASGEVEQFNESPAITVTSASPAEKISNWLDEQPWVEAWNSVTFLRLFFEPQLIVSSIPTVAVGWLISLALVLVGFPLAIPLGLIAAFMKISKSRVLHVLAAIYTGIIRGTPLFLQIYIAFFGMPLLGITINQYILAVCVMAFNSGAYLCEIFRAGIQSIPKGQFEAARSLGMTGTQTMFSVIIPQTIRRVIPTMTSEFILLYKDTSLLAAVGVMELMLYARSVVSVTGNMTPYIVAAIFYLIVTLPLIRVVTVLENRLAEGEQGRGVKSKKTRRGIFKQMKKEISEPVAEEDAAPVQIDSDAAVQPQGKHSIASGDDVPASDDAGRKGGVR